MSPLTISTRLVIVVALLLTGLSAGAAAAARRTPARTASAANADVRLTGAGSTFDAPFFTAAFAKYHQLHPQVSISYSAVGSGGGITRFANESVDFGASDVPMNASELSHAKGGRVVQVPVDLGAVVVSYHVQIGPLQQPLRLTGAVLAQIFLGQITRWNDPAIAALNPTVELPDLGITVVHRADSSGTTYIFTNYLSSVSPTWSSGPGTSKVVRWPTGIGAKGSPGVAKVVSHVEGSIGYFELSYAETNGLPYVAMQNAAGAFVPPFAANVAADASTKPTVTPENFSIVNEPGATSYPISGYSWLLLYARQPNSGVGRALTQLVTWITSAGQAIAAAHYYVPLPQSIEALASSEVGSVIG